MDDTALLYFFITIIAGLCLGSFATALAYRLPRGQSMLSTDGVLTRSRCLSCQKTLTIFDLVPVFSWVFGQGKCRYCQAPIGIRYPLIELATLCLCLIFFLRFGVQIPTVVLICLAPVFVALTVIDLDFKILPDGLNLSILLAGVAVMTVTPSAKVVGAAVTGAIVYGLFSYFLRAVFMKIMKRDPLGLGDVKFFAVAGFWLGLESFAHFLMIAGLSGVLLAIFWRYSTGQREFPFGPALILSFLLCLVSDGGVFLTPMAEFWRYIIT